MGPTSIQRNQEHRYNSTGGIGEQMCENGPPLAKKKHEKNVELNKALCWIIQGYMLSMLVASFTHFWLLCRRGKEKREREREKKTCTGRCNMAGHFGPMQCTTQGPHRPIITSKESLKHPVTSQRVVEHPQVSQKMPQNRERSFELLVVLRYSKTRSQP